MASRSPNQGWSRVVVPENTIRAEMGVPSGELAYACAANSGECLQNEGFLARESPNLRSTRVLRPRTANANEPLGELKPRGDSDNANRRLAESRSPFLPMDARAEGLFDRLLAAGADPWLDKRKLVLGDEWEPAIKKAVSESDGFVVCLRPGFDQTGFRQKEVR